jgi:hypothetical protein
MCVIVSLDTFWGSFTQHQLIMSYSYSEIEVGVREVIALESRYTLKEVQPDDPIDKFVSSTMADRLARKLGLRFSEVATTQLTNLLFVTFKKVKEVVDYIASVYGTPKAPKMPNPLIA